MSHELRTPLNAIIGYSEMLEEEAGTGIDEFVPDLDASTRGKHLLGLINDVLDLSKIEAGRMELYLETFDLAGLVRDLATVEPLAVDGECPELILDDLGRCCADQTKVRQSLLNLLSNAAKFTERGSIPLQARREPGPDGREWIRSGSGRRDRHDPEELYRLFRPFVQADASTTRHYGGTGLGLTITRRFCEMMGGEIAVRSEPGRGRPSRSGCRPSPPGSGPRGLPRRGNPRRLLDRGTNPDRRTDPGARAIGLKGGLLDVVGHRQPDRSVDPGRLIDGPDDLDGLAALAAVDERRARRCRWPGGSRRAGRGGRRG